MTYLFFKYFSTVGQKLADAFDDDADVDADENLDGPAPRRFMFTEVTPDEVYKQLMKMPTGIRPQDLMTSVLGC